MTSRTYKMGQNSDEYDQEDSQEGNIVAKEEDDRSSNNYMHRYELGNKNIVIMKNNEKYAGAFYFTENQEQSNQIDQKNYEQLQREGSYDNQATPTQLYKKNLQINVEDDSQNKQLHSNISSSKHAQKFQNFEVEFDQQIDNGQTQNQMSEMQDNPMLNQILNLIQEIDIQIGKHKIKTVNSNQKTPQKQCRAQIGFFENKENNNFLQLNFENPKQNQNLNINEKNQLNKQKQSLKKILDHNQVSPMKDNNFPSSQKNSNYHQSPHRDTINNMRIETPQFRAESGDRRLSKIQMTKFENIIKANNTQKDNTMDLKKTFYKADEISEEDEDDINIEEQQSEQNKNSINNKSNINQVLETIGNRSLKYKQAQLTQNNLMDRNNLALNKNHNSDGKLGQKQSQSNDKSLSKKNQYLKTQNSQEISTDQNNDSLQKYHKAPKIEINCDSDSNKKMGKKELFIINEDIQDYQGNQENSLMYEAEKPNDENFTSTIKAQNNAQNKESKKFEITLKFGQMFIGHMIELLDDFKELIQSQIDEIIETHDNVEHGNYPHYAQPGQTQDTQNKKTVVGDHKNRQTLALPDNSRAKSIVNKNVPSYNLKNEIIKNKKEIPKSVYQGMATVHPGHENFNMVFNIMIGIKKAVDSTLEIPLLKTTDKDFLLKSQYEIAPYRTDSGDMVKACTFYDYAPQIFQEIRRSSGIKKHQYSKSLGPENILGYMFNADFQSLKELCSSGKSGSFFYYTSDGNFMLKTIRKDEFKMMKSILRNYYDHLTVKNVDSLISRIFGLHKMIFYRKKHKMQKKIYFCIMNNVFCTPLKIDYRYDLKGSTQGRKTEITQGQPRDDTVALKDLNFIEENKKIQVGRDYKQMLMKVIDEDARFFKKCEIIDYSLLVGVHERKKHLQEESPSNHNSMSQFSDADQSPFSARQSQQSYQYHGQTYGNQDYYQHKKFYEQTEGGLCSIDRSKIYYIGIIDIFTGYGLKKKAEHFLKSIQHDNQTISCVPPDQYGKRFCDFIEKALQ